VFAPSKKAGHMGATDQLYVTNQKVLANRVPFSNRTSIVNIRNVCVPPEVMVLYAVGDHRRNIRSEAQALQCPQRAHAWIARPNGIPRSRLHLRPEGQRVTFDRSGERIRSMKD
jgi:hypothetical protein